MCFTSRVRQKLVRYSCACRGLKACLCILSLILNLLWRELFYNLSFFISLFLSRAEPYLIMGLPPFNPLFAPSAILLPFMPYHSTIPVVVSFDPCLLGLFGPVAYSSLNDSIWSLDSYSCYFGLFFFYIACGLLYPIYFFLGILGSFAFLGHPWPFFLILCSHGLLLTPLGFSGLITLSFIFWAYGFSINPLLSLLALLWACRGPFSLFYIICCP